jgi:hypothetical protein
MTPHTSIFTLTAQLPTSMSRLKIIFHRCIYNKRIVNFFFKF